MTQPRLLLPLLLVPVVVGALSAQVPTQQYDHGDPTAEEQYTLELINRARANPTAEGGRLAQPNDPAISSAYNFFGIDTAQVRAAFATYPSRPPLAFNAKLIAAARRHTADMVANNFQGHTGSDGSTFDQRLNDAGYTGWTSIGENVSAYSRSLFYAHAGFNVDWGNPGLGHRHNIMNFAPEDSIFTEIGIGITHLPNAQQGDVGPWVVTHDFGNVGKQILTGVVYDDVNGNGFYDVGEGLPGVTVMPSSGTWFAVTSTSGGYAIPMVGTGGNFTVTFSGGALGGTATRSVQTTGTNIKLDLTKQMLLAAPLLVSPAPGATTPLPLSFVWRSVAGAIDYTLRIYSEQGQLIQSEPGITDTTWQLTSLPAGLTYQWEVTARNGDGEGTASERRPFSLQGTAPAAVTLDAPADGATVPTDGATFSWLSPTGIVSKYHIQIATDIGMMDLVVSDSSSTTTSFVVTGLTNDRDYYWRVRAANASGWGPWSDARMFHSAVSGVDREIGVGGIRLTLAPNPARDLVTITLSASPRNGAGMSVHAADGRVVATQPMVGERTTLDITTLPNGLYIVRVDGAPSQRLLIAR